MKILCLFWSNPEMYPFLREKISYLKKKKIKVTFISRNGPSVHIGKKQIKKDNYHGNFLKKNCESFVIPGSKNYLLDKVYFFYFIIFSFLNFLLSRPNKIFIYHRTTLLLIYLIRPFFKGEIIYQNFDYNPEIKSNTLFSRFVNWSEIYLSKYIDLFILSHPKRGEIFSKNLKVKKNKIIYVYNSLKIHPEIKKNNNKKNLIWTGSIGPGHSLLTIIKSYAYLNTKIKLKIFGKIENYSYIKEMDKLIEKLNLKKRVIIHKFVPEYKIKKELKESYAAIALYEPIITSHKYMAGASAKINNYLAYSLPVIVSNNNDFSNFSKKFKASIPVNIRNPKSISETINKIVTNKKIYNQLRYNSYKAHIDEFNFEKQFKKINDRLNILK